MKTGEVPQDKGVYGKWNGICYSTDDEGQYSLIRSAGWDPVNTANKQAWEVLEQEMEEALTKVRAGELSPIAYHMVRNLMDIKLLSLYTGFSSWKVKRHMKPKVFNRLKQEYLARYAKIFRIKIEELRDVQ